MSFSKFSGFGLLLALITGGLTVVFSKYIVLAGFGSNYTVWFLTFLAAVACIRRLAVLNFLESFLTAAVWLIFRMLFDVVITAPILGVGMYGKIQVWLSYLIIVLVIIVLHKKRHIAVRKEMHAKHHGHH